MKIRSTIDIIDRVYTVQVGVEGVTPAEQELLRQFGMPEVAVGGDFSGSATRPGDVSPTAVTFSLATETRRLPQDFPVKQVFSLDDAATADVQAVVFQNTINSRITSALTTLKAMVPNFVGESLTTVT